MDPLSIVLDEVALEGLDGITLPSLWIRLGDRQPEFTLKLDDPTKELLWRSLISNSDLKFYQLPEERDDVELFDRYKEIDPETGIETTQTFSGPYKDVYPVQIILENKDGIQGSCAVFKQRTDITKHLRSKSLTPLVSLPEALESYGRKLVVVASQMLRFRALIGSESDPDLKLNDDSYCVLERVGRGRWQGELQRDLHGCSFKIDARKLHYMRKSLVQYGLISMQSYCTRVKSGQQQHSILLLLKRFHVNRKSKYDILMENVSNILQESPDQIITMMALREQLNLNEGTLKRVLHYMRSGKLVELFRKPLEELDPGAGPCINRKGNKVLVRCVKQLKPYVGRGVTDEDDDEDEDEEDDTEARKRAVTTEGRFMETDVLTQAYHIVLSCGARGVPQRTIGFRMNIGKLESRMLCRRLERDSVIKGFMEDEGRQRTTKFISHKYVGVSNKLQLFAKEQERKKLLYSSAPQTSDAAPATPASKSTTGEKNETPAAKAVKNGRGGGDKDADEGDKREADAADEGSDGAGKKTRRKSGAKRKSGARAKKKEPVEQPAAECQTAAESTSADPVSTPTAEQTQGEEEKQSSSRPASPSSLDAADNQAGNNIEVVKDKFPPKVRKRKKTKKPVGRSHETYRLLRRKNLIVEAVRSFRIVEGLFPLQKMINDEERQDGLSAKCCKKTILRLIHGLSREGLLKFYKTTIIQDGITKKVELVVHPSIQPNDETVNRAIEQIRFKISSSYSAIRQQGRDSDEVTGIGRKSKADKNKDNEFKPTTVRGLGKSFGFQPKMHRLRAIHSFLWYLIYGHPLGHVAAGSTWTGRTPANPSGSDAPSSDTDGGSVDPQTADSTSTNLDLISLSDEEEEPKDQSARPQSEPNIKVYADEDSWKRFMPPVRVHKEYGSGWAMVGDLLLCLPLSIFVQVIQINYKVDGLEEYLNDPVKQHYLVRALPAKMKRQLLYRRRYIFAFHENLQKLVYMGLLQFGPVEKFKEKDQVFLYLRRHTTIVDTTNAEPHYWLITESPDNPFERRQYSFNTAEDVENYWFDLMCVCLNTPLGVIRSKRNAGVEDADPSFVHERNVFVGLAHLLRGNIKVTDDGSIPGDGKGAAGLDSEFFAHLKRNWLWTSHLLSVKKPPSGLESKENKMRLKSLLNKNALRIALKAGGMTKPHYVTTKRPLLPGNIEVDIEPASRNQQVVGGKKQRRKRNKKEVVKIVRKKKKEPKKRTPAHDAADHKALKRMTRQRVYWSVQEDSLMMLCSVASYLLNSKLKRPFVPHCVVRDQLQAEFENSMDKTSVAVGRRVRYILKNPQTLLNYRICLAEVYQDKPLMKLLEQKKPDDPDNPEDCAKVFSEYVRLLRQKFSAALTPSDMTMPDTKHELFSRFKVSAIESGSKVSLRDALRCTDDIHTIVLHNLIQSTLAMSNHQMKSSRSFQAFHMYSKYDQELLCQVFIQCRKRGLVNRRRVSQPFGPKKNRALPILPMSYQLSQSYYRCFSWRFPHALCTDSFRFVRGLLNNRTGDDRPIVMFYHEIEGRSEAGEELAEKRSGSERKKKQSEGKEAATEPEAQPEGTTGDSAKEGEDNQSKPEGEQKNSEDDCLTAGPGEDPSGGEQTDDRPPKASISNPTPRASAEPPDVSDMLQFSLDSPGGACVASLTLMSLGLLSVYMSIPKQIVVVDSNLVDNDAVKSMAALEEEDDDDDDGDECDGKKRMEVKAHQASHTNYLMMRGYCSPGIVKRRNLNTLDSIVVESCSVRLQMRNTPAHHVFSMGDSPPLDWTKSGASLLPPSLNHSFRPSCSSPSAATECDGRLVEQRGYTPQDVEACALLRRSLDAAGEKGLDIRDLYEAHDDLEEPQSDSGRTRSLQQYMKELQEEGQVLRVGSLGVRWVLMQHADPWLLTVKSKPWPQSSIASSRRESQRHIPFMRKRFRRERPQETEEPPAKKSALDNREGEDGEGVEMPSSDTTNEKSGEEEQQLREQKEGAEEGSGDKLLNLDEEGGEQIQPGEEGAGEAGQRTKERRGGKELRARKETKNDESNKEAHSPPTETADGDDESFISRPWRMVDGSLNLPVCKGMLEAFLYHIMSRPGITQQSLVEHYKDALQPMAVLDLVKVLIDMGCVTKKTLVKAQKPSLFGRPALQASSGTKAKIEEPDTVFYEPTISCCLRLAQVLPNERHWNCALP